LRDLVDSLSIRDRLPQIEVAVAEHAGVGHTALVFRHLLPLSEEDRTALAAFGRAHDVAPWLQSAGPDTAVPLDPADAGRLLLGLPEFGLAVPFAPTDFTQVNHRINEVLVGRAVGLLGLRAHESVADFFCGLGNFTLPLATRARQVVGIEGHAGLVARARQAAERAGLAHKTRFEARNLFDWTCADLDRLNAEAGPIDAVLVDPPREGALALAQSLAQSTLRPRRMVYVSCNPATLARDCAVLVNEGGWQLAAAGVVNMFPHTAHVESMAVLEPAPATGPVV
jgi:23S rRNA (uracil1939-C5)-methyltransferase